MDAFRQSGVCCYFLYRRRDIARPSSKWIERDGQRVIPGPDLCRGPADTGVPRGFLARHLRAGLRHVSGGVVRFLDDVSLDDVRARRLGRSGHPFDARVRLHRRCRDTDSGRVHGLTGGMAERLGWYGAMVPHYIRPTVLPGSAIQLSRFFQVQTGEARLTGRTLQSWNDCPSGDDGTARERKPWAIIPA